MIGKGRVERIVPVNARIMRLLMRYLKAWFRERKSDYVFTIKKGTQFNPMYLWRLIRRYFKPEETGVFVSAHTFRHSVATHLYHNRAPIQSIRDILGHRSIKSTIVYLHLDSEKMKRIHRSAHPRENEKNSGIQKMYIF